MVRSKKVAVLTLSLALLALSAPPSTASGEASAAVSYLYCYSTATTCSPNIPTTSRSVLLPTLTRGATYFWTVAALNSAGALRATSSGTWRFTVR